MRRHIVDHPRTQSTTRRVLHYLRLDREQTPRRLNPDRTRGGGRLRHYLRIARGQVV